MGMADRFGFVGTDDDLPWSDGKECGARKRGALFGVVVLGAIALAAALFIWLNPLSDAVEINLREGTGAEAESADLHAEGEIFVHVTGAVMAPGVYALPANARVFDAVQQAGGFSEDALQDAMNLARIVADGEQIHIPRADESVGGEEEAAALSGPSSNMVINGLVNINAADSQTLQSLSGVGPSTAQKIIDDREANGPFVTIEDLKRVSGIGEKKFASLAGSICVG